MANLPRDELPRTKFPLIMTYVDARRAPSRGMQNKRQLYVALSHWYMYRTLTVQLDVVLDVGNEVK